MKTAIKLALVGAALVSGAANAANVNTLSNSPTGSSLILLIKNFSDTEFFMAELTPTVNDLKTMAALQADAPSQYSQDGLNVTGALNVPASLNGYTSASLAAYLGAADNIGDNIVWTIMGSRTGNGTPDLGQASIVFTSNIDHLANYWDTPAATSSAGAMGQFIVNELNGPGVTFPGGVSTTNGWDSTHPIANQADITFNGAAFPNGASIGAAQFLYLVASGGDAGYAANVYKSAYDFTLSAAGVLTYNVPGVPPVVPIPAAAWLLGSGLMGLVGIGRRRKVAEVATV